MRITFGEDDRLEAEVLSAFREWIVENAPELGKSPRYLPDDGGLNVEGLGWSSTEEVLLLGVRTPVIEGKPLILRVRLKQVDGPWRLSNFEMLPPVSWQSRTTGESRAFERWVRPFARCMADRRRQFDQCIQSPVRTLFMGRQCSRRCPSLRDVRFHKRMRVEGVTHASVGGRGAIVFVDDGGGYQVLWDDDPRLK